MCSEGRTFTLSCGNAGAGLVRLADDRHKVRYRWNGLNSRSDDDLAVGLWLRWRFRERLAQKRELSIFHCTVPIDFNFWKTARLALRERPTRESNICFLYVPCNLNRSNVTRGPRSIFEADGASDSFFDRGGLRGGPVKPRSRKIIENNGLFGIMADKVGFEPTVRFHVHTRSRRAP